MVFKTFHEHRILVGPRARQFKVSTRSGRYFYDKVRALISWRSRTLCSNPNLYQHRKKAVVSYKTGTMKESCHALAYHVTSLRPPCHDGHQYRINQPAELKMIYARNRKDRATHSFFSFSPSFLPHWKAEGRMSTHQEMKLGAPGGLVGWASLDFGSGGVFGILRSSPTQDSALSRESARDSPPLALSLQINKTLQWRSEI